MSLLRQPKELIGRVMPRAYYKTDEEYEAAKRAAEMMSGTSGQWIAQYPHLAAKEWNEYLAQAKSDVDAEKKKGDTSYLTQDPYEMASQVNQFMSQQVLNPYIQALPGFTNMLGQMSGTIGQQLAGQVPSDVLNQIMQQAAERGIATGGMPTSPNSNAAYLRALGLTSMGIQQQGMQNLGSAISMLPVPEMLNPASIMVPERFAEQELDAYMKTRQPVQTSPSTTFHPQGWAPSITPWTMGG
jgi:hypothetical protein